MVDVDTDLPRLYVMVDNFANLNKSASQFTQDRKGPCRAAK